MTLHGMLSQELVRMLARNLDHSPSATEIQYSVSVYEDDLRQRGLTDADADRVKAAFDAIGPEAVRFPTPRDLIRAIPARGSNVLPGRTGYGFINREGQKRLIDVAREKLQEDEPQ